MVEEGCYYGNQLYSKLRALSVGAVGQIHPGGMVYGGLALPNLPVGLSRTSAEIVSGGFKVYQSSSAALNHNGASYCYLAFK